MNATLEAIKFLTSNGYKVEKDINFKHVLQLRQDASDTCHYHLMLRNPIDGEQAYAIHDSIDKVLSKNRGERSDWDEKKLHLLKVNDIIKNESLTLMGQWNALRDAEIEFQSKLKI